ncbi:ABC transporter substrate-binding protein [Chitinophagaceae bacterium LWZ2-11]
MESITIGLLLPTSTILPVSKDFEKGLKEGLKCKTNINVEIIKEFIGQGDFKVTDAACVKLFNYDDVDLVTGVISNRAAHELGERFKNSRKPLIVNNLGAQIPDITRLNEYVFINSPHLWQHAWTMGHRGVKEFGKKGMYIASVYDAGYSFSQMFYLGMQAADATSEWSFSVPPMPHPGELSNMDVIFPFLEQYEPDFVFANFCGAETTLFMNEFIKRGWHKKTRLTGLPYLLTPFAPLDDDITVDTTLVFNDSAEGAAGKAFYKLGLQTGQIIGEVTERATTKKDLRDELAKLTNVFSIENAKMNAKPEEVAVTRNHIKANEQTIASSTLASWETFSLDPGLIKPLTEELSAGWYNPYLCI